MKAVFLLGVLGKDPTSTHPISDTDLEFLSDVADDAGLDASLVFAIDSPEFAAREKKVRVGQIKDARPRVIEQIQAVDPGMVMAFGRTAMGVLLNRGSVVLKNYRRLAAEVEDLDCPVYVTDSLSRAAVQAGIRQWMAMDVKAAVDGYSGTVYGEHKVLLPGTPEWEVMPDEFKQVEAIGFDLETYPGTSPWDSDARIRMAILSGERGRATVVQTEGGRLPTWVGLLLADEKIVKGGSNIAFDYNWCRRFGYEVNNIFDTRCAEHVIDPTNPNKGLKWLALKYAPQLGDYARDQDALVKEKGWEGIEDHEMYEYAGGDGEASVAAMLSQMDLIKEQGLEQIWSLVKDLYPVLADMQRYGMCIDTAVLAELDDKMSDKLAELSLQVQEPLGPINPASATQLAKALALNIKTIDLREKQWRRIVSDDEDEDISTARIVLEREAHKHPVIPRVLEFRHWNKLYGSYIKAFKEKHLVSHGGNHFVHPDYQPLTETLRISCTRPNAQQIPRKPKEGEDPALNIKRQFISRFDGGVLLQADYSQMEMRIAAQESSDSRLLDAVATEDVHRAVASLMFRCDPGDVTEDRRTQAKTIGFATLYGAGAGRISKLLDVTRETATGLIGRYFAVYPTLRRYIDQCFTDVMRTLSVTTPFGFTRTFERPNRGDWEGFDGARVKRQAFNTRIQSTAACVLYVALIEIHSAFKLAGLKSLLINTVHDSLMIDVFPGELETVKAIVKGMMKDPNPGIYGYELTVPLEVDIEVGKNWGEMEKDC